MRAPLNKAVDDCFKRAGVQPMNGDMPPALALWSEDRCYDLIALINATFVRLDEVGK